MPRRSLLSAIALAAIALSNAWAETAPPDPLEPPDLSRFVRWGPFRVRPAVGFSNFGWDDNIFYRTGNETKQGDYTARLSPALSGLLRLGDRAFVTFDEKVDYTAYFHFRSESYVDHSGNARLTIPLGTMGFYVDGALSSVKD